MAALIALSLIAGAAAFVYLREDDPAGDPRLVERVAACDVPLELLERTWRGYYPGRSGDIITIEQFPAIYGNRHSTPWPYTQDVPLVLYGPGYIREGVEFDDPVTVADLAPTFAELLGFGDEFGERDGRVLEEALLPRSQRNGRPRLIFTLVWDGGGDNVLERWPRAWPGLKRLMERGADFPEATVGSSPSITPAVHATIGTGDFPRKHGMPDIKVRFKGKIIDAWEGFSPRLLETTTLGDEWDRANDNEPLVGVYARDSWHAGMIGHGSALRGADADLGVFDDLGDIVFRTKEPLFYMPDYLRNLDGLQEAVDALDAADGEDDGLWRGYPLVLTDGGLRKTPAWPSYQSQRMFQMLENEGYGADEIPDLFYTNYKTADLAGHEWNMEEPEMRDIIRAQDREIPKIVRRLDALVGKDNYVLAFTADHGMAPYPEVLDGWPINMRALGDDIRQRFQKKSDNPSIIMGARGYYLWLNDRAMRRESVAPEDIAAFIRDYRIEDNFEGEELPPAFRDRAQERLYLTALTPEGLERAVRCARRAAS